MEQETEDIEIREDSRRLLTEMFDKDGSGCMDAAELERFLNFMGICCTDDHLEFITQQLDKNHDGTISMDEVFDNIKMICEHSLKPKELMDAFKAIDKNNDGFISHRELRAILMCKNKMTRSEARKLILYLQETYDLNKDGLFDYEEFMKMFEDEEGNPFKPRPKTPGEKKANKLEQMNERTFVE